MVPCVAFQSIGTGRNLVNSYLIIVHNYSGVNEKFNSGSFAFKNFSVRATVCIDVNVIKSVTDL